MKGTVWRRGAGGAALTLLLAVGLGCMMVKLVRTTDAGGFEFYDSAWIPWLVMGLAVVGCLALFAVEFVRLLLSATARGMSLDWKEAAKLVGLLALAYLAILLTALTAAVGDALATAESREAVYTANKLRLVFYFLSGAVGFPAARRGRRNAGIFLVALGVVLTIGYFVMFSLGESPFLGLELPQALNVLLGRVYEGFIFYESMSAFGFVFFAGIKCLLPEKR